MAHTSYLCIRCNNALVKDKSAEILHNLHLALSVKGLRRKFLHQTLHQILHHAGCLPPTVRISRTSRSNIRYGPYKVFVLIVRSIRTRRTKYPDDSWDYS